MMYNTERAFPPPYYPVPDSGRYGYSSPPTKEPAHNTPPPIVLIYFVVWLVLAFGGSFILGYIYLRPYWSCLHITWQKEG